MKTAIFATVLMLPFLATAASINEYCHTELAKAANSNEQIKALYSEGQITEGEYAVLLEMNKNTRETVLITCRALKGKE